MPDRRPDAATSAAALSVRRFIADMQCCKPARVEVGLACPRKYQLCCAWHHIEDIAATHRDSDRTLRLLRLLAIRLLGDCAWPLAEVFWSFQAAAQLSALATVCAERWASLPTGEGRAAYAAEVVDATAVYRAETRPHMAAAFISTFHHLCAAAIERP